MRVKDSFIWQAFFVLLSFFVLVFAPGCTCDAPVARPKQHSVVVCQSKHPTLPTASPSGPETIVPGTIPITFSVGDDGQPRIAMTLSALPARGIRPDLAITGFSNDADGLLGVGYSLSAMSTITRCPRTMAIDGKIEDVTYNNDDLLSLCLDGKRLVVLSQTDTTLSYRLLVDQNIKVVGYFKDIATSYLEAFWPDGSVTRYGATAETRPMASKTQPRAWLATSKRTARGVGIEYGYCFAENEDGTVAEFALDRIDYGTMQGRDPMRSIALVYATRADARRTYTHGLATQQSLRLDEVAMFGPGQTLVKRYPLAYTQSESTGRTLLESVQECGSDGTCKLPTSFHYAKAERGFDDITVSIDAPLSTKASPMFFDVDHDGLSDYVVGDVEPFSTPEHIITEWRIAKNVGGAFATEKVALVQDGSFEPNANGPSDPTLLQPELGTSIRFHDAPNTDLFLHNITDASQTNHTVLVPKGDLTFELVDTNITRPFPLQSSPKGLRNAAGAVHLADVTGDQQQDLISCTDHGTTPEAASAATWTLHEWQPNGFAPKGTSIDTLTGIPCSIEMHMVDANRDSITDLVTIGYVRQGGVPVATSGTYSVHRRRTNGTWEVFDTGLPTPAHGGRTIFVDINGDGLPDAIQSGSPDGRLYTRMNTGLGFSRERLESLEGDGLASQTRFFHLAQPLDWDGDSKTDLLLPMVDDKNSPVPHWVILRAATATNGFTHERIDTPIPFLAQLGDTVDIADPRGPRILDFDANGLPDIAIFLDKKLHIFKNRIAPEVLVGFSDGSNDHDPDEPDFVPNVSIRYGHLIDDSKTKNQPPQEDDFYRSQADSANDCVYPRNCVVGSKRVVRGYDVNDGQGGVRRFELRYRDARADRFHGFLGFGARFLTDVETGATTATFYDNVTKLDVGNNRHVYPFAQQVKKQWRWAPGLATQPNPDQVEMVFVDRTLELVPTNDGQTYFTLATKTRTRRMQGAFSGTGTIGAYVEMVESSENATLLRDSVVEVLDFDEFHNILELQTSTVGIDLTFHTTRKVKNDQDHWLLGLPDTQTECSAAAGLTSCRTITRTTNEFGEVETESTSSNDGFDDTKLTVAYDNRDVWGNITHVTATDAFHHRRESTFVFDDDGMFPEVHIDALGHKTTQVYDKALGVLTSQMDPNGRVTSWGYDNLGRLESETRPDGSQTTFVTTREKIDGVWRLRERKTTTGGADDEAILNSLGQPIRTFGHAPEVQANMPRIMQRIDYDRLSGKVARTSVPIAEGTPDASLLFDEYQFDALGREVRHTTPWNAVTTTKYDGRFVEVTEPLANPAITELDALGRPVLVTDAANGKTKYAYGPFDALHSVTDPGNATTKWTRDAFLRVRQVDEPDRGTTHYVNDGFGDVVSTTDALGRVATYQTDPLGRTTSRVDKLGAQLLTTTWTWDTAPNGIGQLDSVVSPDGVKSYAYNKRGQTERVTLGVQDHVFVARMGYDDVGRMNSLDYPQPLGMEPFGVTREYDAHGFVTTVRDKSTRDAYWQLTKVDQAGRTADELFGNGTKTGRTYHDDKQSLKSITTTHEAATIQQLSYDWDARGLLKSRSDALQPQNPTERFRHDALERLTCAYFGLVEDTNAACATSYGYLPNGNLTMKSDVGILSYTDPKRPHAVTNAAGSVFSYDAVGNQIGRPGGVSITYTPFDLPRTITQGAQVVSFGYDGDQRRIRKTTSSGEILSFEDLFEQVTTANAAEFRYYVFSPERVVAVVTRASANAGTNYLHADHLGSVESVTNANGVLVEKRSYDAFGARRNPQWGLSGGVASGQVAKGFTGHDEEDEFGLINMKGRLFDPRLGRFTTTDPVIADLHNGQSLNKYTYVLNNPLNWVDPTGFAPDSSTTYCCIEDVVHVDYPDGFVPEAVPEDPTAALESTHSLRAGATTDVGTMGDPADELLRAIEDDENRERREESLGQFLAAGVFGVVEGLVPFAAFGHGLADTLGMNDGRAPEARVGVAVGQIVGGVIATVGGLGGELLGGAATVSGVGAALGVPVMVVSAAAVTGGVANIAAGIQGLARMVDHHSDPKFMGGNPKQPTTRMSEETHKELHKDLNNFLRQQENAAGNHMRPQRGNSARRIAENFNRHTRLNAMADFYRQYGQKYVDAARDFFAQHPNL